ncbi:unnamed protein product [Lupinus luteus]|uniref:RRM domain-containing protein n=1 Tax=Lupinus luteus TaxID=3873 RepID=A0AAV1VS62_LUPLU
MHNSKKVIFPPLLLRSTKDEWVRVSHRRGRQERSSQSMHLVDEVISFFFTNFLDLAGTIELWKVFAKCGVVGDIFIPKKRDKKGRRFGFVRFKKVQGVEKLKFNLSNVWIDLFQIKVNAPKFQRNTLEKDCHRAEANHNNLGRGDRHKPGTGLSGRTLVGKTLCLTDLTDLLISQCLLKSSESSLVLNASTADWENARGLLVREICRIGDLFSIQRDLAKEGYLFVKVIPAGGSTMLLKSDFSGDLKDIKESDRASCRGENFLEVEDDDDMVVIFKFNLETRHRNKVNFPNQCIYEKDVLASNVPGTMLVKDENGFSHVLPLVLAKKDKYLSPVYGSQPKSHFNLLSEEFGECARSFESGTFTNSHPCVELGAGGPSSGIKPNSNSALKQSIQQMTKLPKMGQTWNEPC